MATAGPSRGTGPERAVCPALPASGPVTLSPEESAHLVRVRRVPPGAEVVLVDGAGRTCRARLVAAEPRAARLEVLGPAASREPTRVLRLAVSPPEGSASDLLVEGLAWLGARTWVPLLCQRTPEGRDDLVERRRARWERLAWEALKGSGRSQRLEVRPTTGFLALVAEPRSEGLVLLDPDPQAPRLLDLLATGTATGPYPLLAIGPEGGFTADEIDAARAGGARVARLGPTALRVEFAALAAAAQALGTEADLPAP